MIQFNKTSVDSATRTYAVYVFFNLIFLFITRYNYFDSFEQHKT